MAVEQRARDAVFGIRERVAAPLSTTHASVCLRMTRTLSALVAATLLGCGPQRVDAVSCDPALCAQADAGTSGSGSGGSLGSGGAPAASAGGSGVGTLLYRYSFDA